MTSRLPGTCTGAFSTWRWRSARGTWADTPTTLSAGRWRRRLSCWTGCALPQPARSSDSWAEAGHLLVRLLNASDTAVETMGRSGLLRIVSAARGDLFGDAPEALAVVDGAVRATLAPRGLATLRLAVSPGGAAPIVDRGAAS